jgi:hypothetical protein
MIKAAVGGLACSQCTSLGRSAPPFHDRPRLQSRYRLPSCSLECEGARQAVGRHGAMAEGERRTCALPGVFASGRSVVSGKPKASCADARVAENVAPLERRLPAEGAWRPERWGSKQKGHPRSDEAGVRPAHVGRRSGPGMPRGVRPRDWIDGWGAGYPVSPRGVRQSAVGRRRSPSIM